MYIHTLQKYEPPPTVGTCARRLPGPACRKSPTNRMAARHSTATMPEPQYITAYHIIVQYSIIYYSISYHSTV